MSGGPRLAGRTSLTRATLADLPTVAALVNGAYRGETSREGWTTEADYIDGQRTSVDDLARDLASPGEPSLLLLHEAGRAAPLACVMVELVRRAEGGASGYIGMLTVDPALQAGGVGRMMLAAAQDEARRRGADRARMGVVSIRDSLIAWYQRRGYALTGESEPFPYDDARFGAPRRPDLMFVVLEKSLTAEA